MHIPSPRNLVISKHYFQSVEMPKIVQGTDIFQLLF